MTRAIGYIRVSTHEQAAEGLSLNAQHEKIQAYCQLHDLNLVEVISDAGESGKNIERSGLKAVLSRVDKRGIEAVIVFKIDRLSRNVLHTLQIIQSIEANSIEFHSISERLDSSTAVGRFTLTILAALAQMERDLCSERTAQALAYKRGLGEHVGRPRFGFKVKGTTLKAEKEEQLVIKEILAHRDDGLPYRVIADALNSRGIPTQTGKRWYAATVRAIIRANI